MDYSIGIGTYVKRFEKYFKPLIRQIKQYRPDVEINVFVNGEHNQKFDEEYRREILKFSSEYSNIFLNMNPQFRGYSKLINTCMVNSSNHKVMILSDDLTIKSENFFLSVEKIAKYNESCFKMNGSWSHSFLNRKEVDQVGWFDERFLAMGEEDGDFEWRYQRLFERPFQNYSIPDIINHYDQEECLQNIEKVNKKYSLFNKKLSDLKFKEEPSGFNYGIMGRKLICISENKNQYPAEKFYWDNKSKI
jgi:hypothetical protein